MSSCEYKFERPNWVGENLTEGEIRNKSESRRFHWWQYQSEESGETTCSLSLETILEEDIMANRVQASTLLQVIITTDKSGNIVQATAHVNAINSKERLGLGSAARDIFYMLSDGGDIHHGAQTNPAKYRQKLIEGGHPSIEQLLTMPKIDVLDTAYHLYLQAQEAAIPDREGKAFSNPRLYCSIQI